MCEPTCRGRSTQRGSLTLPAIASIGILLVIFVVVFQFTLWIYGHGALRLAVQEAARATAPLDADADDCRRHFDHVRSQLLGGALGDGVSPVRCTVNAERVQVEVTAHFESWFLFMPGWDAEVAAIAVKEVEPR